MDRSSDVEGLAVAWLAGMKAGDAAAVAGLFAEHEATTVIGNGADQWFTGDAYTGRRLRDSLGEQGGIPFEPGSLTCWPPDGDQGDQAAGAGINPSCISIPATSMMMRLSASWPSRYRSSVHDSTVTVRPVAGMPMNGARCVPVHVPSVMIRSSSAIVSRRVHRRSGNAVNMSVRTPARPARPGPWPGSGFCSIKSSATSSSSAAPASWALRTSSVKRRTSARRPSAGVTVACMVVLLLVAGGCASERKLVAQDAGALGAAGEDADELDGVDDLRVAAGRAAAASREIAASRAEQRERVRLAVAPGPLGQDVRDDPA